MVHDLPASSFPQVILATQVIVQVYGPLHCSTWRCTVIALPGLDKWYRHPYVTGRTNFLFPEAEGQIKR
jgi:hypothetical protein